VNWYGLVRVPLGPVPAGFRTFALLSGGTDWYAYHSHSPTRGRREEAPLGGTKYECIYREKKPVPVLLPLKGRFESYQLTNCPKGSQINWYGVELRWRQSTKHERYGVFSLGPAHALAKNKGFRAIVGRLVASRGQQGLPL